MKLTGICILIIGIVMSIISGLRFMESRQISKKDLPEVVTEEPAPVYSSPWTGIFFIAVGGSILILTKKKLKVDDELKNV